MYAMNLIDVIDAKTNYGILFCENENITINAIQGKIFEMKEQLQNENVDWIIEDIINMLPAEWRVKFQQGETKIYI